MAIEIPMDDLDMSKSGGYDKVAKGMYHAEVVSVDEDGGHNGAMVVEFEILRGTTTNQQGKVHRELFFKDLSKEMTRRKFGAFAIATGLATVDSLKKSPAIEYTQAVGKQVVLDLVEFNDYMNISYDHVWHPTSPKANNCPLLESKIKAGGITLPVGRHIDGAVSATSGKSTKPTSSKTPTPETQAANINDLKL